MRPLSDSSRSISNSQISRKDRDITEAFTGKESIKDLIQKANTVPLNKLFKYYGLRCDENNRKITCPFLSHKNGREGSASFIFYPATNTFWCFGCKIGVYACDFVSAMDNCNKIKASSKIIELFNSDLDDDNIIDRKNFSEKLEIMIDFSKYIRDLITNHSIENFKVIEDTCKIYDTLNTKYDLSNDALKSMIIQLKNKLTANGIT